MNSVNGRTMLPGLLCGLCAVAWIIVGLWQQMPPLLVWSIGAAVAAVAVVMMVGARASRAPMEPMGLCSAVEPTLRLYQQTKQALVQCTGQTNRWVPLQWASLYKRPWFLVMGLSGGGKSSLLAASGLSFTHHALSAGLGVEAHDPEAIAWYATVEALWIDTPGALIADENGGSWRALAGALRRVRRRGPVAGVGLVVNVKSLADKERGAIQAAAAQLRHRLDELSDAWGMRLPLYLVFNHLDALDGFEAWLGTGRERAQEQLFGAALSCGEPGEARGRFAQEFELLCRCLATDRLGKLYARDDAAGKRQICQFVIQFEALQDKLACFVGELFKSTGGVGTLHLSGFYFTSAHCPKAASVVNALSGQGVLCNTIVNHPLNPHAQPKRYESCSLPDSAPRVAQALFARALLSEVMVGTSGGIGLTPARMRQQHLRGLVMGALAGVLLIGCMGYLMRARQYTHRALTTITNALPGIAGAEGSLERQYSALGLLGEQMGALERMRSKSVFLSAGFNTAGALQEPVQQLYFEKLRRFVLVPSRKYLEYTILTTITQNTRLDGEQYRRLYNALKSYLSITEAAVMHRAQIDTVALRAVLVEAVTRSVLVTLGTHRLPQHIERVVGDNVGLYVQLHAEGRAPLLQADQQLLAQARTHLTCLPDAATLYQALIKRLSSQSTELGLAALTGSSGQGLLRCSASVSVLYTQQGWERMVSPAIELACKNPFSLDWVVGVPPDEASSLSFDKKQMRKAMVDAYARDYRQHWLAFLAAVEAIPPTDLRGCASVLRELFAADGEVQRLFEAVVAQTLVSLSAPGASLVQRAQGGVAELTGEGVPVEQLAPVSQRLLCAEQELFAAVVHEPFLQLQTLLQTPLGAGFGCAQYRERVGEVVDALERSQRGEPLLNLFNGRASDPLEAVWDATHRGLSGLDPQLAACLEGLLLKPLSAAGQVVAQELTQALNARWQEEVVTPFASRLAGRYPFDPRAEEAAYSDVMEFFRPGTGIFWGFYDRVLCGFVNKNGDAWQVRSGRCITLSLESGGQGTLERAERIGNLFFHPNGELRVLTLSIAASAGTAKVAQLVVDGQALDLLPGGAAQLFYWPRAVELRQGSLQVRIDERCVQGYNFGGPWGLVKLLGQARLSAPSPGTLDATWGVNVQNMYTVYQKYRLQVSGGEHPFGRTFFEGFDCPDKLVAAGAVPLK